MNTIVHDANSHSRGIPLVEAVVIHQVRYRHGMSRRVHRLSYVSSAGSQIII